MKKLIDFHAKSLSRKLVLLYLAITVALLFLVGGSIRYAIKGNFQEHILPHVTQYLDYIQNDIGMPADIVRAKKLAINTNTVIHIYDANTNWSSNGKTIKLSALKIHRQFNDKNRSYAFADDTENHYFMITQGKSTLLVSHNEPEIEHSSFKHIALPLIALLLILAFLYRATQRLIAPINTIEKSVNTFAEGKLDHRIFIDRTDELGKLAQSFNTMADQLQQMLEAKRQLLLAISHELRSPLTRAKVSVALIDDENHKKNINLEIDEIDHLIEEILETERLSLPHKVLNKSDVNLNHLITEIITNNFSKNNIIATLSNKEIKIKLDRPRIKLLLKNLIENALRYTADDASPPEISLEQNHDTIHIKVRDFGLGIEQNHIPHLTEAFYRVDPSRKRETGGFGLGLYLCRMIAEAHGGRLSLTSQVGVGTTVSIVLPIHTTN